MEITHDIECHFSRFAGGRARVQEYSPFGSILRLHVTDQQDEGWVLSFSDCRSVTFRPFWSKFDLSSSAGADRLLHVTDIQGGFSVSCERCFLIHEDEYCADNPPLSP